ncbi:hypothetical protein ACFQJ5_12630 [Halomicroarcula sp. GCM10025324]|uniref:hypothetical protein n=1 Tax=Haloarcula TaxID=2237 RepID=UPI0023E76C08|nr:hypothetical protein [Halomicroarcula sp. ZS-22-S1]
MAKFDDWCEREGHVNGGDKGRHAEQAIIEYLPPMYRPERFRDDLDALEADLRADLDEAGLLSDHSSSKESPTSRSSVETAKLTYRIAEDVQDELERYVYDQEGKVREVIGEYVARALDEYRDGAQVARVRRYYEQLRENVDMVSEDRVGAVIEQLHSEIGEREYYNIETIRCAVSSALDVHSEDVRNDFADRVIERLEFVSVETSDGVYAKPEKAAKLVQQNEVDSDFNWSSTDKKERVEYLKTAVKARSKSSAKGAGVDYNQVRDEVFDQHPCNDYCYKLMELAGEESGFEYGKHNGKLMLRYTGKTDPLEARPDSEWVSDAAKRVQEFCDETGMNPGEVDQPILDNLIVRAKFIDEYDKEMGPSERAMEAVTENDRRCVRNRVTGSSDTNAGQTEDTGKKEMDRLTAEAEPVTDGGQRRKHHD